MAQALLPEDLWSLIEAHLPVHRRSPEGGRPRLNDRTVLTGILFAAAAATQGTAAGALAVQAARFPISASASAGNTDGMLPPCERRATGAGTANPSALTAVRRVSLSFAMTDVINPPPSPSSARSTTGPEAAAGSAGAASQLSTTSAPLLVLSLWMKPGKPPRAGSLMWASSICTKGRALSPRPNCWASELTMVSNVTYLHILFRLVHLAKDGAVAAIAVVLRMDLNRRCNSARTHQTAERGRPRATVRAIAHLAE